MPDRRRGPPPVGEIIGHRVDHEVTNEAEHFLRCPDCGDYFDIRDLAGAAQAVCHGRLRPGGKPSAEFQTTFRTSGMAPASVGGLVSCSATFYGILLPRTSNRSLLRLPGLVLQTNVEAPLQASSGAFSLVPLHASSLATLG